MLDVLGLGSESQQHPPQLSARSVNCKLLEEEDQPTCMLCPATKHSLKPAGPDKGLTLCGAGLRPAQQPPHGAHSAGGRGSATAGDCGRRGRGGGGCRQRIWRPAGRLPAGRVQRLRAGAHRLPGVDMFRISLRFSLEPLGSPPGGCLLNGCSASELELIASQVRPCLRPCHKVAWYLYTDAVAQCAETIMQRVVSCHWLNTHALCLAVQLLELRAAVPGCRKSLETPSAVGQAAAAVSVTPEGEVRRNRALNTDNSTVGCL